MPQGPHPERHTKQSNILNDKHLSLQQFLIIVEQQGFLNIQGITIDQPEIIPYFVFTKPSVSYLPTPPLGQDMTQGQFLSGVFLLLD